MSKKSQRRWGKIETVSQDVNQSKNSNSTRPSTKRSFSQGPSLTQSSDVLPGIIDLTLDGESVPKKPKLMTKIQKSLQQLIEPKTTSDLAVHSKKIEEFQNWLKNCENLRKTRPNVILLVTGPCGSGKLSMVKIICKEMGFDVYEYMAPFDVEMEDFTIEYDREKKVRVSQKDHFMKFLRNTSRFGSIFDDQPRKKVIVVKDFPNIFIESPPMFEEVLGEFQKCGKSPLIFITNDTKGKQINLNFHLFPEATLNKFGIEQITLNPVSNTATKKVLKSVASQMCQRAFVEFYSPPSSEHLDSIILSSQGDLRNAIINLLFSCQRGQKKMEVEKKQIKSSKAPSTSKKLKNLGNDESLTMMHALGKVFNPKFEDTPDGIQRLTNNPEAITDIFISMSNTFVKMIFTNCPSRFTDITDMAKTSEILSCTDILMTEWRESDLQYYGLSLAIRSAMVNNKMTAKGWQSVKGFKNLFVKGERNTKEKNIVRTRQSECDYKSFKKIIEKDQNFILEGLEDEEVYIFE